MDVAGHATGTAAVSVESKIEHTGELIGRVLELPDEGFYSGGCFKNESYGVDWPEADDIVGPWSEIGCERGPQLMCSIPGEVIGPGHNSIVTTPESDDYVVYHAWNDTMTRRQMWIDPLLWDNGRPVVPRFLEFLE